MSLRIMHFYHHHRKVHLILLCDVPERVSHGQSLGLHFPLGLYLVGPLQLLEYEGPHDAVAHHQGQEADV